jgi:uncharacterized protein with NAD-binding domain and iron-sulfur cluster
MSAAHELATRGFDVDVYERRSVPGGKARSLQANQSSSPQPPAGGAWLPGEHGFRFFPRFYKHVVDTMAHIPFGGGSVADNLVETSRVQVARFDRASFALPARFPRTSSDLQAVAGTIISLLAGEIGLSLEETARFFRKLWQFFTSCEERRMTEYEQISWWRFIGAEGESDAYQRFFGHGITRSLVAAKARRASTKTIGTIFAQIIYDILRPGVSADRVLNGPTNDVWIEPWLKHLRELGVRYHLDAEVRRINCVGGRVLSATVAVGNREAEVTADYFIAAVPIERMGSLLNAGLLAADPSLTNIAVLRQSVEWMNGIQFYLNEDVPISHGHTIYLDSPWALTSVSQRQFWPGYDLGEFGNGKVKGIVSVDISNWKVAGLNRKTAAECSREEIEEEVWAQLKRSLNVGGREVLRDDQREGSFLDPDLEDEDPSRPGLEVNTEPLLVNYVGTWRLRPEAVTRVPNLFLASDYVRTTTDLATMEAANEAARRAVNGVLLASRSDKDPCRLWSFEQPEVFAPFRAYDRTRFRRGLSWDERLNGPADVGAAILKETAARLGIGAPVPSAANLPTLEARDLQGTPATAEFMAPVPP